MIVSDAGYGLIYLIFGLFLKWKFKKAAGMGKRLIKLIIILGASCIVWGVITTNFFGIEFAPDNPMRKVSFIHYLAVRKAEYLIKTKDSVYQDFVKEYPSVDSAENGNAFLMNATKTEGHETKYPILEEFYDNIFLEFSLMVGVFHLSLSLLRYVRRNWANIGWILFMIGGYLYFPSILHATSIVNFMGWLSKPTAYAIGLQLVFAGPALVLVLGLIQHRSLKAVTELAHVLQLFADVLSYLRLYALALAGMIMASTFNDMGIKLGLLGGFVVILVGHFVNMNLTIMVGVIHGLRLNFLEWYRYCFKGDGRAFNPLRLRKAK
jgi:V/A-type H+/Na+-transporting ATPase subunit I